MSESKPPPSNKEAEMAVLGAVLIEGGLIDKIYQELQPDDFYTTAHQTIIKTMFSMSKDNIPIDILTLQDKLSADGVLLEIGGSIYLKELTEGTPTTANIDYYIKLVKEASNLRKTYVLCQKLTHSINNKKIDAVKAIQELEDFTNTLDSSINKTEIIQLSQEQFPEPRQWVLENLIPKGFPTTIYGSGGVGKSYLAIFLGINVCIGSTKFIGKNFYPKPLNTLYLDYELDKDEIMRRAIELCNGMGLESIPNNFYYHMPDLMLSKYLTKLPSLIKRHNIGLLIIDSMGASGVDAMDEKSVIFIYTQLKQLGITSILIDHQSKIQSQDNVDNKTPFGSVYKSHVCRSVIHIVQENSSKDCVIVRLVQPKSNFGAKSEEILIDILFDDGVVVIEKSDFISHKQQQLNMIKNYILENGNNGRELIQSEIVDYFGGMIGSNKVIDLLKSGTGKHWNTSRGRNNSIIYQPLGDA